MTFLAAAPRSFGEAVEMTRRAAESGPSEAAEGAWVTVAVLFAVLVPPVLVVAWKLYRSGHPAPEPVGDPEEMDLVGEPGTALEDLAPDGACRIMDRTWPCRADAGTRIAVGSRVLVVGWEGDAYIVRRA